MIVTIANEDDGEIVDLRRWVLTEEQKVELKK